ncbi:MAG: UDP-2,3-diacylglucosamine diphosphatase LpxI [Planctomycetota bacterium]|nr:UDP-2,3-diacylglucosamine diphosphatase LpxI [Planctomycetota bacterium]
MQKDTKSIGVIAGAGDFPFLVVRGAQRAGLRVVVVGLRGSVDENLRDCADAFYHAGVARLGRWIRVFRREGVRQAIMAGGVNKSAVVALPRWRQWLAYLPDWTSIKIWYFRTGDRRNDTLLRAVADEMLRKGVELIDSTEYCSDAMAPEGALTKAQLSSAQRADADLGWKIAREMGRLDVGQSVAVKDKDVIAIEAIEGTDAMIARAGALCKSGGWTLVKSAKPNQDMRFDVPTIGVGTIEGVSRAGGKAIVIEAGKTLILNRDETIALADRHGISIEGRRGISESNTPAPNP